MLIKKEIEGGFEVSFKGRKILEHSKGMKCIEIGKGEEEFRPQKKNQGFFKPKDKNLSLRTLEKATILDQNREKITIQFDSLVILELNVKADKLELKPRLIEESTDSGFINRFSLILPAEQDEKIYGCGEQFSKLNLKGKKVPLWTQEPGLGRDHSIFSILADLYAGAGGAWHTTYFPQCSFISSKNYFVFADNYAFSIFDFTAKNYHRLHFWGIPNKFVIGVQETSVETISSLSELLGCQPPLPDWAIDGIWLGIGGGLNDKSPWSVPSKLDTALDNAIKVSAVWSQDWTGLHSPSKVETYLFWNWEHDRQRYPELPAFIKELNEKGIKFLGYNNCFLMRHGEMYEEAKKNGYLI
jgi:alpha-glucosidase